MEKKKETNAQLQRRIEKAIVHIDRTKDTKEIVFSDKGLRLFVDDDYCVVSTNYHQHVFYKITSNGISRPWLYVSRLVEIVKENFKEPVLSYAELFKVLKEKQDETDYNITTYIDWWLFNIFNPLYSIGENAASQFLVYYNYINNIACSHVFIDEHKDGMTNLQFVAEHDKMMAQFLENIEERQIFEPITDKQRIQQEVDALQEQEFEENTDMQESQE